MYRVFIPGFGNIWVRAENETIARNQALTLAAQQGVDVRRFSGDGASDIAVTPTAGVPTSSNLPSGQNWLLEGDGAPARNLGISNFDTGEQNNVIDSGGDGPSGDFFPSAGASPFGRNVFNETLREMGVTGQSPGTAFAEQLFPGVQAAAAFGSLFGPDPVGPSQSPFANFIRNAFAPNGPAQTGFAGIGNLASNTLRNLATIQPNQTLTEAAALRLGLGQNSPMVGNPLAGLVGGPAFNPGSEIGSAIQNLAATSLLNNLSPLAFSLFGNNLVNQATDNYGDVAARGTGGNFADFLHTQLGGIGR